MLKKISNLSTFDGKKMMNQTYDAVIIGAGIMGCSIAYELSKKGWKTLTIDKLAASGHGSTANTCAVIRVHYSTIDGTAAAYESYKYWENWAEYIGVQDPLGLAKLIKRGVMVMKSTANDQLRKIKRMMAELGIAYEDLTFEAVKEKCGMLDDTSYHPPRRPDDPEFGTPNERPLQGAIYYEEGGYISDPVLSVHNVQVAAESHAHSLNSMQPSWILSKMEPGYPG